MIQYYIASDKHVSLKNTKMNKKEANYENKKLNVFSKPISVALIYMTWLTSLVIFHKHWLHVTNSKKNTKDLSKVFILKQLWTVIKNIYCACLLRWKVQNPSLPEKYKNIRKHIGDNIYKNIQNNEMSHMILKVKKDTCLFLKYHTWY